MSFGENVQKLRKQKGMSQEELAEKLTVTRQTVSKWELDQSTPDLEFIVQLSELFQVSVDYLIKGEEAPKEDKPEKTICILRDCDNSRKFHFTNLTVSGLIMLFLGAEGLIVFIILSLLDPYETIVDDHYFRGLPGYLMGTGSLPYFIIFVLLVLCGIGCFAASVIRSCKRKK